MSAVRANLSFIRTSKTVERWMGTGSSQSVAGSEDTIPEGITRKETKGTAEPPEWAGNVYQILVEKTWGVVLNPKCARRVVCGT